MLDLSRPWHSYAICVLDFETSDLPENGGKAVEVAAIRFENGQPSARFSTLLDPGCVIHDTAVAIHGITTEMVLGAPKLEDVAGEIGRVAAGCVPCAYCAPFDRHFLHGAISGTDCMAFDPAQSWLDPLVMIRDVDQFTSGKGRHRLENACARRGIIIQGAHRAEADALATGYLLWQLKTRIGDISAADLIKRCDARRKVQDAEFQKYLASRPKESP